jgi:glycerate-2-kinase
VVGLVISDVVGDPLDVIASGPTVPDPSTFQDAIRILEKYNLGESFPGIMGHLKRGFEGRISECLKSGDGVLEGIHNFLICTNEIVIQNVHRDISDRYDSEVFSTSLEGEAREVGMMLADMIMKRRSDKALNRPLVILAGGETTVTVRGDGVGGRNQEVVLGALSRLEGEEGVVVASMGTDGVDGTSDAAGAMVDGNSFKRALDLGLSPEAYLDRNDSYSFFLRLDDLIMTGPSGTNVNDIAVLVLV